MHNLGMSAYLAYQWPMQASAAQHCPTLPTKQCCWHQLVLVELIRIGCSCTASFNCDGAQSCPQSTIEVLKCDWLGAVIILSLLSMPQNVRRLEVTPQIVLNNLTEVGGNIYLVRYTCSVFRKLYLCTLSATVHPT